jgi:hypothetical protein
MDRLRGVRHAITCHARDGLKRKGFTEADHARFLDAAHQQQGGPLAARDWLTVFQLPPYAPELNQVEMSLPQHELRRFPLPWLPDSLSFGVSSIGVPSSVQRRRQLTVAGDAGHQFGADAYPAFGGQDAAPSPLFYALGSLTSCNQVTATLFAKDLGITLGAWSF